MWEYIVLAVFFISLQFALVMFGGWLLNFVMGVVSLLVAVAYYDLVGSGLPLGYLIPFIMIVFTFMLWFSALSRSDVV